MKAKCLKGPVHDVKNIQKYLAAQPVPVNITSFTASAPSDSKSRHPTEPPDIWPTYEHVTSSVQMIIANAKQGDFVYIHYSGHGTQLPATSDKYSNKNTGDLALILFDNDIVGSRYLRGLELANLIQGMVKKDFLVTIVLDCCFFGSVLRYDHPHYDADVRATNYDHIVDVAYSQNLDLIYDFQVNSPTRRDAYILPIWLVNPSGYIILTACGSQEKAKELRFEKGGEKSGVLTHFLLRALKSMWKSGMKITHQSLYQHLCVRFHTSWPQQTSMRYGNKSLSFFGKLTSGTNTTFISIYRTQSEDCLRLEAGHEHDVCMNDEYVFYSFDSSESVFSNTSQASMKARVTIVGGLTSDLIIVDSALNQRQVKTG